MKWYCFLFWFVYRFILACLAHFNWCMALYTNCVYFTLWKSYDLLWFWMHFMLCGCFPQLRRENYLIVWSNLIIKRCTQYPHLTYKQLYMALYGGKGTKAERALMRMDTIDKRERELRESRRLRRANSDSSSSSSSSSDEVDAAAIRTENLNNLAQGRAENSVPTIFAEEEEECRKYVYIGQAVDSENSLAKKASSPVPPPRKHRLPEQRDEIAETEDPESPPAPAPVVSFDLADKDEENEDDDFDTNSTTKWFQRVPNAIANRFRRSNGSNAPSTGSIPEQDDVSVSTWSRIRGFIPNVSFNRSVSREDNGNEIDILRPDFSNSHDIKDPKKALKRAKRDRKLLTTRLRKRLREELREAARIERKRRMVTDAIELLLQLLRMMASFMILIGNIRKTFLPAQIRYLKPGHHPYDNYELMWVYRFTTFLDVAMFWSNVMWVYCLQWHLCCRIGFVRFWSWAVLLALIAAVTMLIPMNYAMDQMDLSWCVFLPNTTLEKYQPSW